MINEAVKTLEHFFFLEFSTSHFFLEKKKGTSSECVKTCYFRALQIDVPVSSDRKQMFPLKDASGNGAELMSFYSYLHLTTIDLM